MSEHEHYLSQLRTELHIASGSYDDTITARTPRSSAETTIAILQERVSILEKQMLKILSNANASTQTEEMGVNV